MYKYFQYIIIQESFSLIISENSNADILEFKEILIDNVFGRNKITAFPVFFPAMQYI